MFGPEDPLGRSRAVLDVPPRSLLSNGRYQVLLTRAGTGFSRFEDHALTVWSADGLADRFGFFLYVRDLEDGSFWSAGRRPCGTRGATEPAADARSSGEPVEREPGLHRITGTARGIRMCLETCVLPEADGELRRLHLRNLEARSRVLEVTTYGEVALQAPAAFAGHPAFSRLFVRSEFDAPARALLFRRRARSEGERHPWMIHALLDGDVAGWETDRDRFLGRGRDARAPRALSERTALSGTTGDVLDPVFCLRTVVEVGPGGEARRTFALGAAEDRSGALDFRRSLDAGGLDGAFAEAARREEARLRSLRLSWHDAVVWERLAGALLYKDPAARDPEARREPDGADRLSALGLSAGRPFLLVRVPGREAGPIEREIAAGRRYWRELGLELDIVVLGGELSVDEPTAAAACAAAGAVIAA